MDLASETVVLLDDGTSNSKNNYNTDDPTAPKRAASIGTVRGYLGPSRLSGGSFRWKNNDDDTTKKAHSFAATTSTRWTVIEMGRQQLYRGVPFQALFGLQRQERNVSMAFAQYAASQQVDTSVTATTGNDDTTYAVGRSSLTIYNELQTVESKALVTFPLLVAIGLGSATQFLFGYNLGVLNAPAHVVFPNHSGFSWSLAVSAFAIGGPFGAAYGGQWADAWGRRGALLLATWVFLGAGALQTLAPNMGCIIMARFGIGFASGLGSVLVPIYLGELSPPTLRGIFGTVTQFALVTGILVSNLVALPFATATAWRDMFGITPAVALCQLLLSPWLLESPRWLLARDPKSNKARHIVKIIRGLSSVEAVETEVGHFLMGGDAQGQEEASTTAGILKELWESSNTRVLLVSAIFLHVAQEFAGINAVFYYSTIFFEGVIEDPLIGTILVGAVNVVATVVALFLMDSCGRKSLVLLSASGMFLSCVVIVASLSGYLSSMAALVAVNTYTMFFEFGLGPIPWLIVAEMFEAKYVAVAMSVASQVNWVCNFVVGLAFPYINDALGAFSFAPFACMLLITIVFAVTVMPETQGTSPEELAAKLAKDMEMSFVFMDGETEESEWEKAMRVLEEEERQQQKQSS